VRIFELRRKTVVPRGRDQVFAFFADAGNLEVLTPPWLRFEVVTPRAVEMRVGARIDYRLKVRGLSLRWTSEITAWSPPDLFVDEQVRGPYRLWHHEHRFEERPGGTGVIDHVRYAVPGGPGIERFIQRLVVGPDVARIFDYRQRRLGELFGA